MNKIYLDYNATTPLAPEAYAAMKEFLTLESGLYGNPSSIHMFGQKTRAAVEEARAQVAQALNAQTDEIIFTSCGSESDATAIQGAVYAARERKKGKHIITTTIEHDTVLYCCQYLETQGWDVTFLPVDADGLVNPQDLKKAIRADTILASVMHANNEIGTIQPIAEIGKICKERDVLFHSDAIQTVGKIPVDVNAMQVDLLSLSAHKFYGPKGVGALFVRKGTRLHPLLHGHQEKNRRAGTENVAGIVGCAAALTLAVKEMQQENARIAKLRDRLEKGLLQTIPHCKVNGHPSLRIPNTTNISFEYVEGEGCIVMLDVEGVAVSTGSACSSGTTTASHVLRAIGLPGNLAQGTVRFSLGRFTTEEDITRALQIVPKVIERLRSLSPLWSDKIQGKPTEITPPERFQ